MNKVLSLGALVLAVICVLILFSPLLRQLLSHISIVTASPTMLVVGAGALLFLGLLAVKK